ncbi:ATP-dependent DNA helicase RecG [Prevotella copri]|jgi:ATP-dependent DNA helicase RecG|uniref:ATP-dependent DNA helicase RecG n=1 Tax=Segatella copri TaxID=165179 RepID=A0AAW5IJK0_9BACT|nr:MULTISPECIES: ATP-dependent DNA helicase RecG [Prevotellaceae]MCP9535180.1 ATP-dependent DNA helicase RecG [Segatella copri]MCP9538187.1 ATP-dependent DNA helicase RecG [Segatella copri]MCP9541036.1 ATP-dependent DNA helicase RecG [Segatella copri]MCP9559347.1 ATP-dependent DNA helicase RecG [Segatella copri]MCP9562137.1 ATP-dependent DNA helicase RecG [Segatella copri]
MSSILDQDIQFLPSVGPKTKEILSKELGIRSYGDLLEYYPYKYVDRSKIFHISELTSDMPFVQLKGKILSYEEVDIGKRNKMLVAHFSDGYGVVDLVWFRSAQYIIKSYKVGTEYIVFGKPSAYNGRFQFAHPDIDDASKLQISEMGMQPFYGLTENMKKRGYTSRSIERITRNLVSILPPLPETLPDFIVNRLHLVSRDAALRMIHYPHSHQEMQKAQVRLKFEELFYVQLNILRYASDQRRKYRGYIFNRIGDIFNGFYAHHLPFELTGAQKRVMHEIRADMCSGRQMNRLLQGDVGSGKTLVALMTMLIALDNGYQACLMAPTEILAEQHLQTIRDFLQGMDIRVELLTGIVKGKKRKEILDGLATGDIQILIGTHAVIEDPVAFHRLGVAVIDEQHRFGVAQRAKLWAKSENPPHVLVMTATPIPRTLAMTIYGDLDVSVIDELPPGRKPIQTLHKFDNQLTSLYQSIRRQINLGRQVYIVFPLIKENEKIDLKNLEEGYETLKQAFPEFRLSKIHGRMKSAEKEAEMEQFVKGETQILVATTVIEVGVNVPNASVMVILDAQRFGLSQLHQLRGRVGRGCDQSYCILVTGYKLSEETRKRINIMCDTNDGFRIAEADLKLRGPGDLEGTQQSGMAFDLKIANIARDGQLVQLARTEAQAIIDADPQCEHPQNSLLWNRLRELKKTHINWAAIS